MPVWAYVVLSALLGSFGFWICRSYMKAHGSTPSRPVVLGLLLFYMLLSFSALFVVFYLI